VILSIAVHLIPSGFRLSNRHAIHKDQTLPEAIF
jgi:hypothetical protein